MSKLIIYVREIGLFLLKHENEKDVSFISANDEHGVITNGWLRVSHKKLDHEKSKTYRPYHTHDEKQLLKENEKVQLDVEVWPTSVIVPKGYRLGFYVGGKDFSFTSKDKWSRVNISSYLRLRMLLSLFRTLSLKVMLALLKHDKAWKGQAMYTHNIDSKSKSYHGITTIYSDENDKPYILLPIIPKKEN